MSNAGGHTKNRTCDKCGFTNRAGVLLCRQCGNLLIKTSILDTNRVSDQYVAKPSESTLAYQPKGTATLRPSAILRIEVEGYPDTPLSKPLRGGHLMIGRLDAQRHIKPDIDLDPYEAYKHGVSRCHALLRREGHRLILQDLGSTNGTFVNERRLLPQHPETVRDGEIIRVGNLSLRINF